MGSPKQWKCYPEIYNEKLRDIHRFKIKFYNRNTDVNNINKDQDSSYKV